jgi:hypothetical protein
MGKPPRKPSAAAAMLGLGGHHRIDPDTLRSRVQEREQRAANDTRTEVQRWLGDPQTSRSALANRSPGVQIVFDKPSADSSAIFGGLNRAD